MPGEAMLALILISGILLKIILLAKCNESIWIVLTSIVSYVIFILMMYFVAK